jgi:type I restriction enzyme M protein
LVGTSALFDSDAPGFVYPDLMVRVRANPEKIDTNYLLHALKAKEVRGFMSRNASGSAGSMPKINQTIIEQIPIPLPPLAVQREIVAEIEAEQRLVEGNRQLIERMEQKVAATLARIWGEAARPEGPTDAALGREG